MHLFFFEDLGPGLFTLSAVLTGLKDLLTCLTGLGVAFDCLIEAFIFLS